MAVSWDRVDEMTLALLHLTAFRDRGVTRAWKGHDWGVLDRLHERGWILDPRSPARSVVLTEEGLRRSQRVFEDHFGVLEPTSRDKVPVPADAGTTGSGNCQCGCGAGVEGNEFLPGHDQKLRVALERQVGGLLGLRDLVEAAVAHARGDLTLEQLGAVARVAHTGV